SPGHIQIMIALVRGPQSIGRLAEIVGVSPPAATQLVDRLAEHGIVERRHDPKDRRIVLVDYTPGERELAQRIMENRRKPLRRVVDNLTDDEARAFLKGLQLLADSFRAGHGET
ncbi:MAG: MarR family transcriptional regulator, partial [Rubrobacteraceae bacterium]